MSFGPFEIILVIVLVLLLFGAKKLPELAKGMGKSIKEFKHGMKEDINDDETKDKDKDSKKIEEKA